MIKDRFKVSPCAQHRLVDMAGPRSTYISCKVACKTAVRRTVSCVPFKFPGIQCGNG